MLNSPRAPAPGTGKLVKAAIYLRCSTMKQEDSPDRQRSQVVPYAERNGYEIVATFADEGVPGDEIERRPEFCKMLEQAKRGKFRVILCDDVDRFGRFDSLQLGEVASPLVRAGVRLVTVAQGEVGWTNLAGRINSMLQAEFKKSESKDISRRVITAMLRRVKAGEWVAGLAPYGYAAVKVKDEGTGRERRTLVPVPAEAEVVRWVFAQIADRGMTVNWVAQELTERRTPLPRQKGKGRRDPGRNAFWYPKQVADMLRNRAYVGDIVWNRTTGGGYSEFNGEQVLQHDSKTGPREHGSAALVEVRGTHEAIVTREQFQKVQEVIAGNRKRTTPKRADEADYLFTRMLVCSRCGSFMVGRPYQRKKGAAQTSEPASTDPDRRFYMCGGYFRLGKTYCKAHTIPEAPLRERVVAAVEAYCRTWIDGFRATLQAEIDAARQVDHGLVSRLKAAVADLDARIATGEQNLMFEPRDTPARRERAERMRNALDEMAAEREQLSAQLAKIEDGSFAAEKEQSLKDHEEVLWMVREALTSGDAADVRRVMREVVSCIKLSFNYRVAGKRELSSLAKAEVILRPQTATYNLGGLGI